MSGKYLPVVAGVAVAGDHVLRLLDPEYFAQVTVDSAAGTIAWPDGIDLAPEPLYEQARFTSRPAPTP